MIISRQFAEADYGRPLRALLASNRQVEEIVDFGSGLVFDGVGAYTVILRLTARAQNVYQLVRVPPPPSPEGLADARASTSLAATVPVRSLDEGPWDFALPRERQLVERLRDAHPNLADATGGTVFQGVVTGADNGAFRVLDRGQADAYPGCRLVVSRGSPEMEPFPLEEAILRPVYEGRAAISRFRAEDTGELLLLPYARARGEDRYILIPTDELSETYPHAWRWLTQRRSLLEARRSGRWNDTNWYAYSRRQNLELFEERKVLVPYMVDALGAHWDTERHFFVNVATGGYGLIPRDDFEPRFFTALLNSGLLSWILRIYSRAWRGNWFAARKGNLIRLPIAQGADDERRAIVESYDRCVALRRQVAEAISSRDQELADRLFSAAAADFDALVFDLYALSSAEREVLADSQ